MYLQMNNDLLKNIEKIHSTELGIMRIKRNLELETNGVVNWCKEKIKRSNNIHKKGKNWYITVENCILTVNANSYTIITAHKIKGLKMDFLEKTNKDNSAVLEIIKGWGSDIIVSRGKAYKVDDLDGILVFDNGKIIGLGLYYIKNDCEIVLLETLIQNKGIGTQIIEEIKNIAKKENCKRIWLVTTNSNINAIKFYQKRGFNISNIYINAMEDARRIKPEIPIIAENGIEIRDEIEFEIKV